MARVWNISDVTANPQVIEVGGVRVAPGGSVVVSSRDLNNISSKYPSNVFAIGGSPPDRYLAARRAKAAAKLESSKPKVSTNKGTKSDKKKKQDKKKSR